MTIDRNDPRWTAYVLNELDPRERAEFEEAIQTVPDADEILSEIGETVGLFSAGLHGSETEPERLTAEQQEAVRAAVAMPSVAGRHRWAWAGGIAAALLVGIIGFSSIDQVSVFPPPAPVAGTDALPVEPSPEVPVPADGDRDRDGDGEAPAVVPEAAPEVDSNVPATATIAQEPEDAELFGTVTDATGALIPGVEVRLTDPQTGRAQVAVTNGLGAYRFADVDRGAARLTAQLPGFETFDGNVQVDGETELDVALEVRAVAHGIEVVATADSQLLTATGASIGEVISANEVAARARSSSAAAAPPSPVRAEAPMGQAGAFVNALTGEGELLDAVRDGIGNRFNRDFNTEEYARINDNPFFRVADEPLATFSVDVDTAAYANVRRFITQRTLPPPDAVRIEEMVNYFTYDYQAPDDGRPVRVNAEVASAPWKPEHRLVRLGIQGEQIERGTLSSNLVFLLDVSGSMNSADKLPLLRDAMKLLVEQLGENDRVAIAVYAGASGLVLDSTPGDQTTRLIRALDRLQAGGSTNGGAGIELAYDTAIANFIEGGNNRVILATDGDFNIGVTNQGDLTRLIEEKAESGVFLSVLGFGTGNLSDARMESLADRGNGNYAYIDTIREARKVLVEEAGGTLITIARDVKFQVEFNPAEVNAYRLIGYENRVLENQDFSDDTVDAGEIGAGHTVTALFEVVPVGVDIDIPGVDPLRYQQALTPSEEAGNGELLTVSVRYKEPDEDASRLIETPVSDSGRAFSAASTDFRFASAVAGFGMVLRTSPHRGDTTFDTVLAIAEDSIGADPEGYREEFVELVRRARAIRELEDQ